MAKKKTRRGRGPGRRGAGRGANDPRKPEWSIVTFDELEGWRAKNDVPKKRLAHLIGVTNSTWHNWARGKATATLATQRRIRAILDGKDPEVLRAAREPSRRVGREARAGRGAAYTDGVSSRSESVTAAASIVNTFQQTHAKSLSREQVLEFLRDVLRVLG